jgi:hypothetical protein
LDAVLQASQLQIEFGRPVLGKVIDHPPLMAARDDQSLCTEVSEVFGNGNLGQSQDRLEMADAERTLRQKVKDPQAGFITEAPINVQEVHILW